MSYDTPILLLTFNRPEFVKEQILLLRKIKAKYIYIFSDGPRIKNELDRLNVSKCRNILDNEIDWNCLVKKKFEKNNIGCGLGVSGAITWFFSLVEEGLIIEDDCLLSESFFEFAEEMLNKYRFDESIAGITADYRISSKDSFSYGLIPFPLIWGWATWKRAWDGYKPFLNQLKSFNLPSKVLKMPLKQRNYWEKNFKKIIESDIPHTWDYQFTYLVLNRDQKFIHPFTNLVKNMGFNDDATHTKMVNEFSFLERGFLRKPYKANFKSSRYEEFLSRKVFSDRNIYDKYRHKLKPLIKNTLKSFKYKLYKNKS